MPATQLGAMPQTQLDSLPLMTAQTAASGGTVSRNLGGGVTRFFDPVTLGISAVNFAADANGFFVLVSNFISVYGCRSFAGIITRTNAGVGVGLGNLFTRLQYRLTATDVPPTSLGVAQNVDQCGTTLVNTTAMVFPAMQVAAEVQRMLVSWDDGELQGIAGVPAMIGDNVRLYLTISALPAAGNLFSVYLWGTS